MPSGREDVFADDSIDNKAKRSLMKFLRHISQENERAESDRDESDVSLAELLSSKFQVPTSLHHPIAALSLSPSSPRQTTTSYAFPRIRRHLRSIGVFGPGFGSVIPKWGGGAELAQVACRAGAVGGGVYVLGTGIKDIDSAWKDPKQDPSLSENGNNIFVQVTLSDGQMIKAKRVIGSPSDLPFRVPKSRQSRSKASRSINVVSSSLEKLFSITFESGPIPAGTVVVFPGETLQDTAGRDTPPVYLVIHSSDTGECPTGQCERVSFIPLIPRLSPYMMTQYEYLSTLSATPLKITYL